MKEKFTKKELQEMLKHCELHNKLSRLARDFRNTTDLDYFDDDGLEKLLRSWVEN